MVFNNEVTVIGDASKTTIVTGDKLFDFDALLKVGEDFVLERPVSQSSQDLIRFVIP